MFASRLITRFFIFCSFVVCLGGNSLALAEHEIKSSRTNLSGNQADPQSLLNYIDLLIRRGDFALAGEEMSKGIDLFASKNSGSAHGFLQECLKRVQTDFLWQNKASECLLFLDKAVQVEPSNGQFHGFRSAALFRLGRLEEALKEISLARQLEPNNMAYRDWTCGYLTALGRNTDALKEASAALALAPNDAHLHARKYHILLALGRRTEALPEIMKAIELDPKNAEYHGKRADSLFDEQQLANAEREFNAALAIDPTNHDYRLKLLIDLCAQRKLEELEKRLGGWLVYDKHKSKPDIVAEASMRLHYTPFEKEEAEPLRVYTRLYERIAPKSPDFDWVAVGAYCALGENQQAMKMLRRALANGSNPLSGCGRFDSDLPLYSPNTMTHVHVLDELLRFVKDRQKSIQGDSSEIERLTAIQRHLEVSRNIILGALCTETLGYKEECEVVKYLEEQRRSGMLTEPLYVGLVKLQTRYGNFSAALSAASEGLNAYPKSSSLMKLRASVNDILGRKKESLADIKQVQSDSKEAIKPEKFGALKSGMLGSLLPLYNNDRQGFDLAYKQALQAENEKLAAVTSPDRKAQILLRIAELKIFAKDYEAALKLLEEAVKVGGNSSKSYELSAWALEGLNKHDQAAEARRAALTLFEKK